MSSLGLTLIWALGVAAEPQVDGQQEILADVPGGAPLDSTTSTRPPSLEETFRLFEDRLDPSALDAALVGLAAASEANPGDVGIRLLRARAEAFWCDLHVEASAKDLATHLSTGVEAAHGALLLISPAFARASRRGQSLRDTLKAVGPAGAEALYWFAEDQHRLAAVHGLGALLLEATDLRAIFGRVAELAPQTYYGGPYRHLAELSLALPYGWSEGLKLTEAALQQAIVLGPGLLQNHLTYAQRWAVKAQDYGRFRAELRLILEASEDLAPEVWPENEIAKRRARELSGQSSELFTRAAIARGLGHDPVAGPDGGSPR